MGPPDPPTSSACAHPRPGGRSARVPGGSRPAAADRQSHHAAMCAGRSRMSRSLPPSRPLALPRARARGPGRRPGGAQLEPGERQLVPLGAEPFGDDPGHRAAGQRVAGHLRVQRLGQPAPADLAEQRIGRDLRLHLGADVRHQPEYAVPAFLAVRVVEQHQPSPGDVRAVPLDGGRDGRGVRGQSFRSGHVLEEQVAIGLGVAARLEGGHGRRERRLGGTAGASVQRGLRASRRRAVRPCGGAARSGRAPYPTAVPPPIASCADSLARQLAS